MRLTIYPSKPEPGHIAVTVDTLTNEDSTQDAVRAALDAIVASGHAACNVRDAAIEWAESNKVRQ